LARGAAAEHIYMTETVSPVPSVMILNIANVARQRCGFGKVPREGAASGIVEFHIA
jgi:hypothetical protein